MSLSAHKKHSNDDADKVLSQMHPLREVEATLSRFGIFALLKLLFYAL